MITLTSDALLAQSASLKSQQAEMETLFAAIQTRMHQLSAVWNSPASQSFLNQFDTLTPVFHSYCETIAAYSLYLDQTAQAYQETEAALAGSYAA